MENDDESTEKAQLVAHAIGSMSLTKETRPEHKCLVSFFSYLFCRWARLISTPHVTILLVTAEFRIDNVVQVLKVISELSWPVV